MLLFPLCELLILMMHTCVFAMFDSTQTSTSTSHTLLPPVCWVSSFSGKGFCTTLVKDGALCVAGTIVQKQNKQVNNTIICILATQFKIVHSDRCIQSASRACYLFFLFRFLVSGPSSSSKATSAQKKKKSK